MPIPKVGEKLSGKRGLVFLVAILAVAKENDELGHENGFRVSVVIDSVVVSSASLSGSVRTTVTLMGRGADKVVVDGGLEIERNIRKLSKKDDERVIGIVMSALHFRGTISRLIVLKRGVSTVSKVIERNIGKKVETIYNMYRSF